MTSCVANTLVVMNRDEKTGWTTVRQVIRDGRDGVQTLGGVFSVALGPDAQFVYTSAGRYRGDNAIGGYKFDNTGKLSLIQEIVNDQDELNNFVGGNEITVSPDGRNVYAVASRSGSLACFERDLKTGKLRFLETKADDEGSLSLAAGICLSPDGKFVYVAAEGSQTVSVYHRKTNTN